jgi:hypothetical protein
MNATDVPGGIAATTDKSYTNTFHLALSLSFYLANIWAQYIATDTSQPPAPDDLRPAIKRNQRRFQKKGGRCRLAPAPWKKLCVVV